MKPSVFMTGKCRKFFLLALLIFLSGHLTAQSLPKLDLIRLERASDYKAANPFALQTAIYLLSTPFDKENQDRIKGLEFIVKWMSGTPDHSFVIDDVEGKVTKGDPDVLGLYLAALTRYTLENKEAAKDINNLKLNGVILLLNYCENKNNNFKMTKQLKKLSEARSKGQLEKAL
jgi:hypothetical protein